MSYSFSAAFPNTPNNGDTVQWDESLKRWIAVAFPGGGSITPLSQLIVVDPNGGGTDGAFSGTQAYNTITDAIAAVVSGGTIFVTPFNYSSELDITVEDKSFSIVGMGGAPNDTVLPIINISSPTVGAIHLGLENVNASVFPEFNASGALTINAFNTVYTNLNTSINVTLNMGGSYSALLMGATLLDDIYVNGGLGDVVGSTTDIILEEYRGFGTITANGALTIRNSLHNSLLASQWNSNGNCSIFSCARVPAVVCNASLVIRGSVLTDDLSGLGVEIYDSQFLAGLTVTGSLVIDAESYLQGIAAGVTFPTTTTVIGLPSKSFSVSSIAVADDGAPHIVLSFTYPDSIILGFASSAFLGITISPVSGSDTPSGSVGIESPAGDTATIAFGPIPAGNEVYIPFSFPGDDSGVPWLVRVIVDIGTGDCVANNISLNIVPQ